MKLYPLACAATAASLLFVSACAPTATKIDPKQYTIGSSETVELEHEELSPELQSLLDLQDPPSAKSALDEVEDAVDQLIRIGKKIYQIVDDGKPSYNATYHRAHIVPKGTQDWQQFTGWQAPTSKRYRWVLKNLYGVEVVKLTYRVMFTPGGSLNGTGKYLQHVTILPEEVLVRWGFNMNVTVSMPSITNFGTLESPVAAAELLIDATVTNVMNTTQLTQSYYVNGLGTFKQL